MTRSLKEVRAGEEIVLADALLAAQASVTIDDDG